jgi:nucleotide-binding universal stress UspA family protein
VAWLSKILAPVEFSPSCLSSARYAEALACHFHSDLTLLHVLAPPLAAYSAPDVAAYASLVDLDSEMLKAAQARLAALPIEAAAGKQIERVVMEGDAASSIADYAREGRFDMIVMPTHGYGRLHCLLQGSVTAKVLQDARCPVWTGAHIEPSAEGDPVGFHTVLCALDLEAESRATLDWAAAWAREYGAQLHVVHVIPGSSISVGGVYFDPQWHDDLVSRAHREIDELQSDLHTNAKTWIRTGEAPRAIREVAARLGAELLVIGRGTHTGLMGKLQSHAYSIVRESPCPAAAV